LCRLKIYNVQTVIFHVGLYGCETWYVTSREEHRLRVFDNGALRKVFGPKGEEIAAVAAAGWRELRADERHGVCSAADMEDEVGGECSMDYPA